MKIVIAPDSFKGSLTAKEVANVIKRGVQGSQSEINCFVNPIADGGEGTVEALLEVDKGTKICSFVHDPLFRKVKASYGILSNDTCVIEVAAASGLTLLKEDEQNPLQTTSQGSGELILEAYENGARNFIIGLGGSATNDGGMGILHALGYHFFDSKGKELLPIGENLIHVAKITEELRVKMLLNCKFSLAVDVTNPLYGENGAAVVFAQQKGASVKDVEFLDKGLHNFHLVVSQYLDKKINTNTKGFGAAGGIAFGMASLLNATIVSGINFIADQQGLEEEIASADYIISGEGKIDSQSLDGKVISGIAALTKKHNKPLILIGGQVDLTAEQLTDLGVKACFSISNKPMSLTKSMSESVVKENLEFVARQIVQLL